MLEDRFPDNLQKTQSGGRSVVEEPQVGVDQSDSLLITGVNDDGIGSWAGWSCDVVDSTL